MTKRVPGASRLGTPGGDPAPGRPGGLQASRLSDPYKKRLVIAGEQLQRWCCSVGTDLATALSTPELANDILIRFVQACFDSGSALWLATHAVLLVQTARRDFKGKLRPSWDSILSWRLRSPVRSRTPLPIAFLEALRVFGVLAAVRLDPAPRGLWWRFSALLGAGFGA